MGKKQSTDKLGYIKLHRSIEDNRFYFSEPFTYMGAWIDLLILANHKENTFNIRGNMVTVKRGEIARSQESLAERWKWSRGKVSRYLNTLQIEQQIIQQKSHIISTIQIINYDKYQNNNTTERATDGQQTVQQTDINNNDNHVKNEKKVTIYPDEFELTWQVYPANRRENKGECYSKWQKIPNTDRAKFAEITKKYVEENSKENYKYVKKSHRWFKDWETQIEQVVEKRKMTNAEVNEMMCKRAMEGMQ